MSQTDEERVKEVLGRYVKKEWVDFTYDNPAPKYGNKSRRELVNEGKADKVIDDIICTFEGEWMGG